MSFVKSVSILVMSFLGLFSTASAEILTSLEGQGLAFVSSDYENTQASSFGFFGATVKSYKSENDLFKINLTGMYAVGHPVLSYMNLREIYFSYEVDETSQIHVGRKIHSWSDLDRRWHLGFFQPEFRWNSLNPETQGLTGLFWEKKTNQWGFTLFGSPLFIPDQGPGYEIKDGQFQSNNPWFQSPPQNVIFQGQSLPIDYNVNTPSMSEVLFQPSLGLQFKWGEREGFQFALSSIYKPSHQLALGYKGVLVTDRVKIDVLPKTYYENLVNLDLSYRTDSMNFGLSTLYLKPQNPDFETNYNRPTIEESVTLQPFLDMKWNDSIGTQAAYFYRDKGQIAEVGPDADPRRLPLTGKTLYKSAYQLAVYYRETYFNKVRLKTALTWLEAENKEIQMVKSENTFDLKGPWKFNFNFILIETNDQITSVSAYRNLDQVWLGAGYDF